MSKTAQGKQKGRSAQKEVAKILQEFSGLEPDDIVSRPMGSKGEDLMLSPAARKIFPWDIEVKHHKAIAMSKWVQQAMNRSDYEPVVIFRQNHQKEWYATVRLDYLLELKKNA